MLNKITDSSESTSSLRKFCLRKRHVFLFGCNITSVFPLRHANPTPLDRMVIARSFMYSSCKRLQNRRMIFFRSTSHTVLFKGGTDSARLFRYSKKSLGNETRADAQDITCSFMQKKIFGVFSFIVFRFDTKRNWKPLFYFFDI